MMKQVKKTFKPEFINRLSGAVVFHDMDKPMATLILQKKLRELDLKLAAKSVKLTLTSDAFDFLLKEGFTEEYGAREMDRVISQKLKPLLMREILFGKLKKGGNITIDIKDGSFSVG
jgi:ATP-dependent Clp protease ATP-binding subunit ClpA